MIGAIVGDVVGSSYELHYTKSYNFDLFTPQSTPTDDTVLTIAVADCILNGKDYTETFKKYGREYPLAGYGSMFLKWLGGNNNAPYNSYGNGSAMRVSPIGFAFSSLEEVLKEAEKSAAVTHNHPEGIKGAQAVASAIFLARTGASKDKIREYIEAAFGYNLHKTIEEIRPYYSFDETCQGSVPQAIIAFLESKNYEDAVRKAVSLGGDSDTLGCMTGGIAQAYYKEIPKHIIDSVREILDTEFLYIIDQFTERYMLVNS